MSDFGQVTYSLWASVFPFIKWRHLRRCIISSQATQRLTTVKTKIFVGEIYAFIWSVHRSWRKGGKRLCINYILLHKQTTQNLMGWSNNVLCFKSVGWQGLPVKFICSLEHSWGHLGAAFSWAQLKRECLNWFSSFRVFFHMVSHYSVVYPEAWIVRGSISRGCAPTCKCLSSLSACFLFMNILLAKVSQLAKPRIKGQRWGNGDNTQAWLSGDLIWLTVRARSAKWGQDFVKLRCFCRAWSFSLKEPVSFFSRLHWATRVHCSGWGRQTSWNHYFLPRNIPIT